MKTRDRLVVVVIAVAAVLAGFWFLVLAPKRNDAAKLSNDLSQQQQRRDSALAQVAQAQTAQSTFPVAYSTVVRLGKAVPPNDDVPSLIYQLQTAASAKNVNFKSIASGGSSAGGSGSGSGAAAAPAAAPAATPAASTAGATSAVGQAGFQPLPFTFEFAGGFFPLYRFLRAVDNFTVARGNTLVVNGRLLTIQAIAITLRPSGGLTSQVTATAYDLPAGQSLTGSAGSTAPGPIPAAPGTSTQPTPAATKPSSGTPGATPAATIKVSP